VHKEQDQAEQLSPNIGKVQALKPNRYGFISHVNTDYFFHISDLVNGEDWDRMRIGSSVTFTSRDGVKGPVAKDVRFIPDA
jgi:cold shock CspA family protein